MKIVLSANTDWYLYNFRKDLIKLLISKKHDVYLLSTPGKYSQLLQDEGFNWAPIILDRNIKNPINQVRSIYSFYKKYKEIKPDIIHHFTLQNIVYGSFAATFAKTSNIVNAITGLGYYFTSNRLSVRLLRIPLTLMLKWSCNHKSRRLIVQNRDDLQIVLDRKISLRKYTYYIPSSGVDINRFSPNKLIKKKDSKIKILMATRLLRAKGIYDFVNAAKAIKPKFSHVNFYLAGEPDSGNPSSIDSKEFHQWKNDDYIEILGHVNSVENLLAKMDIVALPSQYGEGVPRILVEAAACGLPLVATDVPGCREIVFDGKTGLLVPPGDLSSLIDALEKLIKDAEFRRTCGEQSRLHCEENYSSNVVNNKTMQVYESLNMNRS